MRYGGMRDVSPPSRRVEPSRALLAMPRFQERFRQIAFARQSESSEALIPFPMWHIRIGRQPVVQLVREAADFAFVFGVLQALQADMKGLFGSTEAGVGRRRFVIAAPLHYDSILPARGSEAPEEWTGDYERVPVHPGSVLVPGGHPAVCPAQPEPR